MHTVQIRENTATALTAKHKDQISAFLSCIKTGQDTQPDGTNMQ